MKVLHLLILFFSSLLVGESTVSNGYQPGDTATDFKLKSVDGKMDSMADYKNKGAKDFIVVFTCNTCPLAINYVDRKNQLRLQYNK